MWVLGMCPCTHICSGVPTQCLFLRLPGSQEGRLEKDHVLPWSSRFVFSRFSPHNPPTNNWPIWRGVFVCIRGMLPLHCPCMPFLLMERLASLRLSHAQFVFVAQVSQANIYSGPKPLGRVSCNINSSRQ